MTEQAKRLPIAARYTRSVHIARDFDHIERALEGYQATPLVLQTLKHILDGLNPDSTMRAFSLVGVYGTGKSAFGLFLAYYLGRKPEHRRQIIASHAATHEMTRFVYDGRPLLPVLVSGNNRSLRQSLLSALSQSLYHELPSALQAHELFHNLDAAIQDTDCDPERIAHLFEHAHQWIGEQTDYGGLLLIIDELGQYLDYLFRHDEERDLFVLQALAEMAARSGQKPLVMLTILHQAFDRYATTAGAVQRIEWKKVQGRFVDLPFQEPDSQMMRMVGYALCSDEMYQHEQQRHEWARRLAPHTEILGLRPAAIEPDEWHNLLARTWPLHPTVLVMLPILFRHLAQNERSLFSFLTSQEPWSFHDMIDQSNDLSFPIYRLPHLFAYVEATMGAGLYHRTHGRRWAELVEALARIPESEQHKSQVLTTIGTLNALGQHHRIQASEKLISFALQDTPDNPHILETIQKLEQQQHITYRRFRESYIIWQGSDLDLDKMVQDVRRAIDHTNTAKLLQQSARILPMVARRHSYRTGAVRHFAVRFVAADDVPKTTMTPGDADGEILYIVPADDEALQKTRQWASEDERTQETQRIVVIPQRIQHINDLLLEVTALQRVLETQPELEHDGVAHRELSSRLVEAQQVLDEAVTWAYHPGHGEWWWCGVKKPLQNMRQLDNFLSEACDRIYQQGPRIWNELIVRRHLSSAGSKARRNLVEAMLDHGHLEALGLEGYPPEQAIYESVLKASGIHCQQPDGRWHFDAPDLETDQALNLSPVWNAMQHFINSTHRQKKPIIELFKLMEAPPYGVKAGLVPLLFMAIYLANAGEIALYEHGSYVTLPDIAVFERLMRHPDYFSIRQFQTGGVRMKVYERIASVLAPEAMDKKVQPALLDAVNPLLRFIRKLPEYSQHTKQVGSQAQAIRQALLNAQEPDIVLFESLAQACGVEPFVTDESVDIDAGQIEPFFAALRTGLLELQNAYDKLVVEVAAYIGRAFATQSSDYAGLHEELSRRSRQMHAITADTQIRALVIRLEHAPADHTCIESIGELVTRKPMTHWHDTDYEDFKIHIANLGRRFCSSEKVAVATQIMPPEANAMHMSITDAQGEHSRVIWNSLHDSVIQTLHDEITDVFKRYEHLNDEQRLRVLAELLRPLLQQPDESEVDNE